jgi:hypothetical protein
MQLALMGGAGALALGYVVKQAMGLGEQADRAKIVFGDFAGDVLNQAQMMGDAFGVSKMEFIQSAGALGSIFKAGGYTQEGAKDLSIHFVKLATDLSSLVHIPVADALLKIQSGLAGQVRPLREVGVLMSEEAIEAYAAAHGIAKLGATLTEQEKVQARVGYITNALSDAHGNLAKTADSAANRLRGMWGEIDNLAASIGATLLPIVGAALGDILTSIQVAQGAWTAYFGAAADATIGVIGAAQQQTTAIGFIQKAIGAVGDSWQYAVEIFKIIQSVYTAGIGLIVQAIGVFVKALEAVGNLVGKQDNDLSQFFDTWGEDLKRLSDQQAKEFQGMVGAPRFSEGLDKAFQEARDKTAALRADLAKTTIDVTKILPTSVAAKPTKEHKFAEAAGYGTKEAANIILRSKYGNMTSTAAEKTAQNTAKANSQLDKLIAVMGGAGGLQVINSF